MTPKEKAEELVDYFVGFKLNPYKDIEMHGKLFKAKRFATFTVNQILSLCWNGNEIALNYWQEVKNEIEKL